MDWPAKYVGLRFAENGRTVEGCDCWGLVCLVYSMELGVVLPDFAGMYAGTSDIAAIGALHDLERPRWDLVDFLAAAPFDLVSLRVKGRPWHVGIVTEPGRMLHALPRCDAVVEDYTRPLWKPRIDGFYRYRPEGGTCAKSS
jgi:cell wall-associated NlpC family hydrolase